MEPHLRGFRSLFVELSAKHTTLLVTTAMAVDLMGAGAGLDQALTDLEELWVSAEASAAG